MSTARPHWWSHEGPTNIKMPHVSNFSLSMAQHVIPTNYDKNEARFGIHLNVICPRVSSLFTRDGLNRMSKYLFTLSMFFVKQR